MRAIYPGAAMALAAGVLLGGAMRPDLAYDDRPMGPQIFAGGTGHRAAGPFDEDAVALASYAGRLPDYVLGTDWRRAGELPAAAPQPAETAPDYDQMARAEASRDEAAEAATEAAQDARAALARAEAEARVERASYAPTASYPSMDGGAAYEAPHRPAGEAAPAMAESVDAEAPPEATGDTRPVAR